MPQDKSREDENTLHSQYSFTFEFPEGLTASQFLLQQIEGNLKKGLDHKLVSPITGEETLYRDFERLSRSVASGLFKRGFAKGDTLIYSSHNAARLHLFLIGVWCANGIVRASYPEDTGFSLLGRIEESKATWILCDEHLAAETVETARKAAWKVSVVSFGDPAVDGVIPATEFLDDDGADCPALQTTPDDVAMILATSGTTGASKGAVYSHKRLIRHFVVNARAPCTDDLSQYFLLMGKLTHLTGSVVLLGLITSGRNMLMMSLCGVQDMLETIEKYRPQGIFAFPSLMAGMINHPEAAKFDLTCIKYSMAGGAAIGPAQIEVFKQLLCLKHIPLVMYGLTESGMVATNGDFEAERNGIIKTFDELPDFSCGKLVPGTSLQVRDMDTGKVLGPGRTGELYVRTRAMCNGYYKRPEETESVFPNGWLRTGDLGYYDAQGFIFIVDRVKEVFKYFNNHIAPSEIENVIQSHPGVRLASVIGVTDPEGGDKIPKAFVVLKQSGSHTSKDIADYTNSRLETYKHLRGGLELVDALPLGKTGKVLKTDLEKN